MINPFLKAISIVLTIGGGILLLLGLAAGGASLISSLERLRHGPGPFIADAEYSGLIALICCALGAFSLVIAKRLRRSGRKKERLNEGGT